MTFLVLPCVSSDCMKLNHSKTFVRNSQYKNQDVWTSKNTQSFFLPFQIRLNRVIQTKIPLQSTLYMAVQGVNAEGFYHLFNSTRICFAFAPRMYDSQTPDIIALFNKVQVNVHQQWSINNRAHWQCFLVNSFVTRLKNLSHYSAES